MKKIGFKEIYYFLTLFITMPKNDKTGPIGTGLRDGSGRKKGGRGQSSTQKGSGKKTGGKKGSC